MGSISRRYFVGAAIVAATTDLTVLPLKSTEIERDPLEAFMSVSQSLTNRSSLDRTIGARLLAALQNATPDIVQALTPLAAALSNGTMDTAQEPVALKIMKAWYLGDVDKTVVTYEQALMFDVVSDVLPIRSYCGDAPGFWATNPNQS